MNFNPTIQTQDPFAILGYKNLGQVRVQVDNQGEPWFCLRDIASIIGIQNSNDLLKRIDSQRIGRVYVWIQTGVMADGITPAMKNTSMNFVNEAGLYQAIGQSRKPEAKKFLDWVFSTVIPAFRRKNRILFFNRNKSNALVNNEPVWDEAKHKQWLGAFNKYIGGK